MLVTNGLGAFTQAASCADGDFICGPRGGIFSCRPCDFPQLNAFKALQRESNRLVKALGMDLRPCRPSGGKASGGNVLAVDGRIGPCTTRTVTRLAANLRPLGMAPPEAQVGRFESRPEYVARFADELRTGISSTLSRLGHEDLPPPPEPRPKGTGPATVPSAELPSEPVVPLFPRRRSRVGAIVAGTFVVLATVGTVGAGVYSYKLG